MPSRQGFLTFFSFLLLCCGPALGQETASILGTVADQSGAVVPNATVTLTNTSTGASRSVTTNQAGSYNAPDLPIGTYTVKVDAPGFKTYEQQNVSVNVNATVRVDVSLQVGQAQETVTVEANAVQVQVDTSEQSNVIYGQQITKLDTNGRNPVQLATLVPGASGNLSDFNPPTALASSENISFNGQRSQHNVWRIDGGEAYDRGSGGGLEVNPSPDALAEFRVLASNYSAEFGAGSGATVNMAIKSGTKDYHASAWEFNRNDFFDATDYFANRNGTGKPKLRYNAYGFNIGGPVYIPKIYTKKDRTFFFYNMEWRKLIQGSQLTATGIPAPEFNGDFSGLNTAIKVPQTTDPAFLSTLQQYHLTPGQPFPNNVIPAGLINPNAKAFLATGAFPFPNTADGRYSAATPVPTDLREEIVRIDHRFTDKLAVMGHLIYDSSDQSYATTLWGSDTYPTIGTLLTAPSYSTVINLTYSISPTVVNEVTYNFNGNKLHLTPTGIYKRPSDFNVPEFFPANNDDRLPRIDIGTPYNVNYDPESWPWNNVYGAHVVGDNVSWTRGKHNFQLGGNYIRSYKQQDIFGNTNGYFSFNGNATGNSFADFLLGFANNYQELQIQDAVNIRFNQFAAYAEDNWRVTNRLTLNLGLRWEGIPHAYDKNGRLSNFLPGLYNYGQAPTLANGGFNSDGSLNSNFPGFTTVSGIALSNVPFYLNGVGLAGRNGVPQGLVQNHWNNWGPRVGFAYDVGGDQKTVLRGGFGMFYERIQGNDVYNMGPNPPFSFNPNPQNVFLSNPAQSYVTGATATIPVFPASFTALGYSDYKLPVATQFSFGIQRQISQASVLNVAYVGSVDYHQPDQRNINTVPQNDPNRLAICGGNCGFKGSVYNANFDRIYPGFSNITLTEAASNSNYNSLQVSYNWQSKHGLSLQGAYTWSHELDYTSGDLNALANPFDRRYDYASGDLDRRHTAVISYVYELPFFKNSGGVMHSVLGGWSLSGITIFQSGLPLSGGTTPSNFTLGYDNLGLGGGTTSRPNVVSPVTYPQTVDAWFSTASFAKPAPLQFGNAARNSIRGPGRDNWNVALFKSFALPGREGMHIEFRGETYNTFNHTQFNQVDATYTDANFGKVTSTWDPRIIQLGAKFVF
jgi:Carboxypeptidase regulatory-like domain